jgi:hypothetical protein
LAKATSGEATSDCSGAAFVHALFMPEITVC